MSKPLSQYTYDTRLIVKENPGITVQTVADKLGLSYGSAANYVDTLLRRGDIERTEIGRSITNRPRYGYYLADPTRPKPKPVSKAPVKRIQSDVKQDSQESKPVPTSPILSALDTLAESLAQSIVQQVKAKLAVELSALTPEPVMKALPSMEEVISRAAAPVPEAKRLKRVLIVGLLPQQAGIIASEFHDCFALRFWKDEDVGVLKSACKNSDEVFIHTDHISHSTEEVVKAVCGAGGYTRVAGGMTSMRSALQLYYKEECVK